MFSGCLEGIDAASLDAWMRKRTPVPYVHMIKKAAKRFGHIHFETYESACDFFFQFRDTTLEGPYGDIKFMAAKHFSSQTYVTYRKDFGRAATEKKKTSEPGDKGAMRERTLPHDVFDDGSSFIIIMEAPSIEKADDIQIFLDEDDGRVLLIKTVFSQDAVRGKRIMTRNPLFKGTFTTRINLPERLVNEFVEFNAAED